MQRRQFIKGVTIAASLATLPITASSVSGNSKDWRRIADETNTFGPDGTFEVRLSKFNKLTGMGLTVLGPDRKGLRAFVYPDGRTTGPMDEETAMHWTAQVGLGYRLAKAQGL